MTLWFTLSGLLVAVAAAFEPAHVLPTQTRNLPIAHMLLSRRTQTNEGAGSSPKLSIWNEPDSSWMSFNRPPRLSNRIDKSIILDTTGFCLEAMGDKIGAFIVVNTCNRKRSQQWDVWPGGHGQKNQIRLAHSDACIGVSDKNVASNEVQIELQKCSTQQAESWMFEEPIPLPTAVPEKRRGRPSSIEAVVLSMTTMAVIAALHAQSWWRKHQKRVARVCPNHLGADHGGICLLNTSGEHQGSPPLAPEVNVRENAAIPAVMALGPLEADKGNARKSGTPQLNMAMEREDSEDAKAEEEKRQEEYRTALQNAAISVLGAVAFGAGVTFLKGPQSGIEFASGYLVEESLSVDNLFVFLLIFDYFRVPREYQERVLAYGIIGAVVLRALFIGLGAVILQQFKPVLLVFAAILLYSSGKLLFEEDEDEDLSDNKIVKLATDLVDATDTYDGDKFFTIVNGVRRATPLLLVVACIELSDIVFALDSVPAVFGVTDDPFIVFTSNLFAIIALRSLYQILSAAAQELVYLKPAVAIILGFVGAKLASEFFGYEISNEISLSVISTLLLFGVGASVATREKS